LARQRLNGRTDFSRSGHHDPAPISIGAILAFLAKLNMSISSSATSSELPPVELEIPTDLGRIAAALGRRWLRDLTDS
jgi:hypothetical protein